LEKANYELGQWQQNENSGQNTIRYSNSLDATETNAIKQAGKAKANIRALNQNIIPDLQKAIEKATAIKEKADADAKAKAQAEADAKAEADRIAKMKELNNQLVLAKTPQEKASVQAQIDALAGNVAKGTGSSKMLVYGVVGLVVVIGLVMVFKKQN
jgi:regulator of protease activity HflC (stomatin/prohibitin superfamily)